MGDSDKNEEAYKLGRIETALESLERSHREGNSQIQRVVTDLASKAIHLDDKLGKIERRLDLVENVASRSKERTEEAHRKIRESSHDLSEFKVAVMAHVDASGKAINTALDAQNEVLSSIRTTMNESRDKATKRDEAVALIVDSIKAREAADLMNAKELATTEAQRDVRLRRIAILTPAAAALVPLLKWLLEIITSHH